MVKRVLYDDIAPGVTDFDLIIVDEAHRGYILDRELSDDEISFRDQSEYQSKYRSVIEYFDAVKITLTATPAIHTTEKALIDAIKNLPAQDAKNLLLDHEDFFRNKIFHDREFVISEHEDRLTAHERGFGEGKRPQDYLDEFTKFIADNRNDIVALNIVCTRPKDLTRSDLKNLLRVLRENNFSVDHLNAAISKLTNAEITADIISLIRRYALGAQLVNHADKISNAIARLKIAHNFSDAELNRLDRIEKYLLNETLIDAASFDERGTAFKQHGGFDRIDKVFGGKLANILDELNRYLYDDGENAA